MTVAVPLLLMLLAPQGSALTSGGRVWTYRAGGVISQRIALGDRGGQLLALVDSELLLLSSFDANPPAPAWRTPDAPLEYDYPWLVASADADVYVRPDVRGSNGSFEYANLKKYRSGSSLPDWTYSFLPLQIVPTMTADVSRDGDTIVSLYDNQMRMEMEIRVHDPATGSPVRTIVYPYSLGPAGYLVDVSPDGSVAAYADASWVESNVFDLGSGGLLDTVDGELAGRQSLSEEGRVLATHQFFPANRFHVFRRVRDGYAVAFDVPDAADHGSWNLAVSDDGSTVVVAWGEPGTPGRCIVRAYDVATGTMTMEHVDVSPDGKLVPSDVAISADGSRFVVGVWGTGSGAVSELAVYSRDSSAPIREHPDLGAVFDVELSSDGKRYAALRRLDNPPYEHVPEVIEMYELGGEDLVVHGVPAVGRTITFELHGTPGSRASLLRSPALAPTPIDVAGAGTLHLDPGSLTSASMGTVLPSGVATYSTNADLVPGMIGRTLWFQGFTSAPRRLTADFVQLTVLP